MPVYQGCAGEHCHDLHCPAQINLQGGFNLLDCFRLNVALEVVCTVLGKLSRERPHLCCAMTEWCCCQHNVPHLSNLISLTFTTHYRGVNNHGKQSNKLVIAAH